MSRRDLIIERDHALRMAGTSSTPRGEASLWLQIATEIDEYLAPPDEQLTLAGGGD